MINSYYTGPVRQELEEKEAKKEARQEAHRERVRQATKAYDNMNHYSNSPEQKKMYEMMWKSLL
jgi:hypothetical protein